MDAFVTSTLPQKRQVEVDVNKKKSGRKKTRKYDSSCRNVGFTVAERKGVEHPQCVICCKVLDAECMLPSKRKRYLTTNHNNLFEKPHEVFPRKLSEMNKQSVLFSHFLHTPAKTQLGSFKVAYRIAKCMKPHTIAEELGLAAALDLVSTMIGESVAQKLRAVPLSNNTVCRGSTKFRMISVISWKRKCVDRSSAYCYETTTSISDRDAYLICCVRFIGNKLQST